MSQPDKKRLSKPEKHALQRAMRDLYGGLVAAPLGMLCATSRLHLLAGIAHLWSRVAPAYVGWLLLAIAVLGLVAANLKRLLLSLRAGLLDSALLAISFFACGFLAASGWCFCSAMSAIAGVALVAALAFGGSVPRWIWGTLTGGTRKSDDDAGQGTAVAARRPFDPAVLLSPDAPIEDGDADWIGRDELVDRLITLLVDGIIPGQPLPIVALTGPLGSGKTSVLKLLQLRLEVKHPEVVPVYFSAWLPPHGASFAAQLLGSIEDAVSARYVVPILTRRLRRFASIVSGSLPDRYRSPLDRLLSRDSQTEQIEALCRSLERLPAPVIVLVDELDRMQAEELHALFKILRGIPQQRNVRFICALDIDHVARTLAAAGTARDAKSVQERHVYLEKFFPHLLPLPDIEHEEWRSSCVGTVRRAIELAHAASAPGASDLDRRIHDDWGNYAELFATIRRARTVMSRFYDRLKVLADECNVDDLFHLSALESVAPEIVSSIRRNRQFLVESEFFRNREREYPDRGGGWPDWSKRVEFFGSEFPRSAGPYPLRYRLLRSLFLGVEAWLSGTSLPPEEEIGKRADSQRHIWIPEYFDRYFGERVDSARLSEAEGAGLLRFLAQATDPDEVAKRICGIFTVPRRTYVCLQDFQDQPGLGHVALRGFIDAAIQLPAEVLHGETRDRLLKVVILVQGFILKLERDENERAFSDVISNSEDICLAAGLLLGQRGTGELTGAMKFTMADRCRQRYFPETTHPSPLALKDPELPILVFEMWEACGGGKELNAYLRWDIPERPGHAARLIYCLQQRRGYRPEAYRAVELADKFFGSAAELLAIAESADVPSEQESVSLRAFRSALKQSGPPPPGTRAHHA